MAPHIDDAEFGCGGTISRLIEHGSRIHYLAFSDCKESIPEHLPSDILRTELEASVQSLKISSYDVLDFPVRHFDRHRQSILQKMVDVRQALNPDLVFTPSRSDIHQDHQVITNESLRAFKHCTILGYELPWNCLSLSSDTIITLSEEHLKNKIEAIQCYDSQAHRIYHNAEYIKALAMTRGLRINKAYAEPFEMIRLIID
ncbi:MAG: PIG-L family deacetylase [Saprospiraceae bacterium]|nr:PIG-L family deacetylase [Saprospiraceae bacterium]